MSRLYLRLRKIMCGCVARFFLMKRRPPRSTRTDTLVPYTTRFRSRLIFSGITNELPPSTNRRLMIDIGGGSTEVIIGKGFKPLHMSSLYMGCVSYTRQFFPDGHITEAQIGRASCRERVCPDV